MTENPAGLLLGVSLVFVGGATVYYLATREGSAYGATPPATWENGPALGSGPVVILTDEGGQALVQDVVRLAVPRQVFVHAIDGGKVAIPTGPATFLLAIGNGDADPLPTISEIISALPLATIVWVPRSAGEDTQAIIEATFEQMRREGRKVVGISPTAATQGPEWGSLTWADITNPGGIPASKRI